MLKLRYIFTTLLASGLMLTAMSAIDVEALRASSRKGSADASLELAGYYFDVYDCDNASEYLSTYRRQLGKGRKAQPDRSGDLQQRIELMETMLGAVQDIEVIDSIVVDKRDFFEHYGFSDNAGALLPASALPGDFKSARQTVAFLPQSGRNVIWGAPFKASGDSLPHTDLCVSWRLYGGEWEHPRRLADNLALGANANWPFMAPDGVTLYYASDGEGSLGGYDIFKSVRSDDGFYDPVNMGMPYNSPYDDYLLVIDETLGLGWWATDRNQIPDKVTIYMFVPAQVRENLPTDDERTLASRARLSSIRDTWRQGRDYGRLRQAAKEAAADRSGNIGDSAQPAATVMLTLPDGNVCTSASQLRGRDSRDAWDDYVKLSEGLETAVRRLVALRIDYASGNRGAAAEIKAAESAVEQLRARRAALANTIIKLEGYKI